MLKQLAREHGREWAGIIIVLLFFVFSPWLLEVIQKYFQFGEISWKIINRFIDIGTIALILWLAWPTMLHIFKINK